MQVYDLHNHVLPDLDDGAKDFEESVKMLKIAQEEGILTVAATPHFILDGNEKDLYYSAKKRLSELQYLAAYNKIEVSTRLGFELLLNENIYSFPSLSYFTIEGSSLLLFETSSDCSANFLQDAVLWMRSRHLTPVLAHPERYSYSTKKLDLLRDLNQKGLWIQINTSGISGQSGQTVMNRAKKLVNSDLNFLLGSDAHSPDKRPPQMKEALKKLETWVGTSRALTAAKTAPELFFHAV